MNTNLKKVVGSSIVAASFLLLAPAVALACPVVKSDVKVQQYQTVHSSTPADLEQSANIFTATNWGNNFSAESKTSGTQKLWDVNKAQQAQSLSAGSQLWWAGNTGPTKARATTTGGVEQHQKAWGAQPMAGTQDAGIWQKSQLGSKHSQADADIHQGVFNVKGDLKQAQKVSGSTKTEGQIWPGPATCVGCAHHTSTGGGSFFSRVTVIVDNLFNF